MSRRASLEQYHRALVHIWAVLTAPRRSKETLSGICKLHGVSVNVPAVLRSEGYIEGKRSATAWAGVPTSGVPTEAFARYVMDKTLASMRDASPAPVAAPSSAAPEPAPVQLALDPDADVREQLAALTLAVSALIERQGVAA